MKLRDIAATAALCSVTWLCIEASLLVRDSRHALPEIQGSTQTLLANANGAIIKLNGVTGVLQDAAQKQADFYDPKKNGGATQQVLRLIVDAKHLLGRTDLNLNGNGSDNGVLPALGRTLTSTSLLSTQAALDLDSTTQSIQPIMYNLLIASHGAADIMASPDVTETLHDMRILAENADITSANLAETANDIKQVADAFRSDYLKPRNRLLFYMKTIIGLGANAGNISSLIH